MVSGVFRPVYNITTYADQLVEIRKTPDGWTNTSTSGFGTDLSSAWRGADNLTKIDREINTSNVTNFSNTWGLCSNLTTFPLIDTSSGTNFNYSWSACGLTSFPLINTSNGTSFFAAWDQCGSLANFPLINTSSATDFSFAWRYCSSLTSFPLIDTSSGTNFNSAWQFCSDLTSFPLIDTSSGQNFQNAWRECSSLTTFPLLDTSSGTNFSAAWLNCNSLTSFPLIDTSLGVIFDYAWINCRGLTTFPLIDTSNAIRFTQTWSGCTSLTTFPANMFDTTGTFGTNAFQNSFNGCALTSQSIGNILSSLDTNGQSNNTLTISGGTNAFSYDWGSDAWNGFYNLVSKGWTISYNDNLFSSSPLDLQFATTKTLDSRISFSRASTATYVDSNGVIQTAAADTARFDHNPDTLESLGLLVEESRTNSEQYSQGFTSGWSLGYAQTTTGQSDPMGGTDAILVKQTNGTSTRQFISSVTGLNFGSNAFTVSVFVKYVNYDYVIFTGTDQDNGATGNRIGYLLPKLRFQFSTETISFQESTWPGSTQTLDYGFEKYPNGWYRLWMTRNISARTNRWGISVQSNYAVSISDLDFVTGDNSSSVLAFGFQVEQGSFPTSYIPTSGSAVTRAADVASITGTNFSSWYNQSEGTVFSASTSSSDVGFTYTINDGSNSNRHGFNPGTSNGQPFVAISDITTLFGTTPTVVAGGGLVSYAYKANDYGVYGNGTSLNATSPATVPVGLTELAIGFRGTYSANSFINGHISRITYWPKRLTDTSLQYLTQ